VNKTYFDNMNGSDLPAFLEGLNRFIGAEYPVGKVDIPAAQDRANALIAQVGHIAGPVGNKVTAVLRFLAELEVSGRFDKALFGTGTLTGKTQPYKLIVEDLSTHDPHCEAVSFMRFKKGNPWFGFDVADIQSDTPRMKTFERRVRKKKTELTWSPGMSAAEIQLNLWSWFARCPAGVQFTDSPDIDTDLFSKLAALFPNTLQFSDQAALFEAPNSYAAIFFSSLGWVSTVSIPNAQEPHAFTPAILKMMDIDPDIIADEVARAKSETKHV